MVKLFNKYPVNAVVYEPRKNGFEVLLDKVGRFNNKDGSAYYKLKKKKAKIRTTDYKDLVTAGGGKVVSLYMPNSDEAFPMELNNNEIKPINADQRQWFITKSRAALERWRKQGFFEKYGNLFAMIVFAMVVVIMLYVVRSDLAQIISQLGSVAGSLAQATENLAAAPPY